jgi:oligopeptide/dipeptide ABC transporter ATP-binding protein
VGEPLVSVRGLRKHFPVRKGVFGSVVAHVKAVDDVSFDVATGETLGLVGESGCGKTTAGRSILRLIEPTAGDIRFRGEDVRAAAGERLRAMRRHMQIIFQDPYASLNPRMSVLDPGYLNRYPHEFSGGQRQRIGIARAISLEPDFIVCDEAVSALDVSIQAQVINLLMDLRDRLGLSYLFVAHDLSVVRHISHRVAVMYLGKLVEIGRTAEIFRRPKHPYTQALLSAVPVADPSRRRKRIVLGGDVPSPLHPPPGCPFHPRCPAVMERCRTEVPPERTAGDGQRYVCHLEPHEAPGTTGQATPPGA